MAMFATDPRRFEPYRNFKFRVKWQGRFVAGFSTVSSLWPSIAVTKRGECDVPSTIRKSPGSTKFEPITLERGLTHDPEFERWAYKVWDFGAELAGAASDTDFRKDIMIGLYNEVGQLEMAWNVCRCWVSEFQAMPDIAANANTVAIAHIRLENEGWERDLGLVGSADPSITEPSP